MCFEPRGRCPSALFSKYVSQFIKTMRKQIVVENLNETLSREGGTVDFGSVVRTEERMGGMADNTVDGFNGQSIQIETGFTTHCAKRNQYVGDDGVGS